MQYSLHSVQTQESIKDEAISRKQYAYSYSGATGSHPFSLIILYKGKHRRNEAIPDYASQQCFSIRSVELGIASFLAMTLGEILLYADSYSSSFFGKFFILKRGL
jgi:hypothetical protein